MVDVPALTRHILDRIDADTDVSGALWCAGVAVHDHALTLSGSDARVALAIAAALRRAGLAATPPLAPLQSRTWTPPLE